jgi:hypothetical protein
MIDIITSHDLQELAETTADRCVSIFLPTHRAGPEQAQDPIRLKNLLAGAASDLAALGARTPDTEALLAPATSLLQDAAFWAHQDNGLALYLSPGSLTTYRLPEVVEELAVTADRFHLKPLIPSLAGDKVFYVLALSMHQVRLLRGSRVHVTEIDVGDIPQSLAEALWWEDRERQLQSHATDRVGLGRVTATFHGHGGAKDTTKADLGLFFRAVDDGITHLITDPSAPLVLAGVEYLLATYRKTSRYARIVDRSVEGNPEQLSSDELHTRAWPLAEPLLDRDRAVAADVFLAGSSPTSSSLPEILPAAGSGRVATLFVASNAQQWGTFDPAHQHLDLHDSRQPGDRDLLDSAAVDTLSHGGTVFAVARDDVPGDGSLLAATLRY